MASYAVDNALYIVQLVGECLVGRSEVVTGCKHSLFGVLAPCLCAGQAVGGISHILYGLRIFFGVL